MDDDDDDASYDMLLPALLRAVGNELNYLDLSARTALACARAGGSAAAARAIAAHPCYDGAWDALPAL